MEPVLAGFVEETARQLKALHDSLRGIGQSGTRDPTEAICRLPPVRLSFDRAASLIEHRLDCARTGRARPLLAPQPGGHSIPTDAVRILWLALVGLSAVCFAAGFFFGRHT
jgi:hypothetical protein